MRREVLDWFTDSASGVPALPSYSDDLAGIYDWWSPTRGTVANTNNVNLVSWDGYVNGTTLTVVQTTEKIPAGGTWTMDLTNGGLVLPNNPNLAASDYLFCFHTRKNGAHAAASWLFDTVGGGARCIFKFEISNVNANAGLQYNGVDYDFGYAIPKDNVYRAIGLAIRGTVADLFVNRTKVGTITGLTGGQITLNTSLTRRICRGGSTILNPYNGEFLGGIRIYNSTKTDGEIANILDPTWGFSNAIPQRSAIAILGVGQSNMEDTGSTWDLGTLAANLQGDLDGCWIMNHNNRKLLKLSTSTNKGDGTGKVNPFLSFAKAVKEKNPTYDVFLVQGAVGGSRLTPDTTPPSGTIYTQSIARANQLLTILSMQNRLPASGVNGKRIAIKSQGESDAGASLSSSYQANEASWNAGLRTDFGCQLIITDKLHAQLPVGLYPPAEVAAINTAKQNNSNAESPDSPLFDPSNTTTYPVSGDNVHYTQLGAVNRGYRYADFVPVYT